ncbi:cytochrome P450 724B1-like isoform X3 [Magnolia sinica]|uniref:cytochrome P450 724B1-like isoform X3 n=1 Tax=Magnolia sinica TaxID=86752 RepID=UPI0026582BF3|nr:cytochrome P450 724B1-like isoform X3 [Magnolia sinica]
MDGWFWSSAIVAFVGLIGLLLYLIISHFMPLYLKLGVAPKGSFGWPLVGETLSFLSPHASNTLGSFLQDHCNRYGKVFKSHLFCSPTVVSCDQELNNFILQNEEKLFQCSYPKPIHGILGTSSMLVVVGDTHKRLRSLALTLVSTTKSKPEYLNDIERIAIQIMDAWKDKKEVIFCEEARKFTFNVIVKQVLGLTPEEPQTSKILEDFLTFMKGLISFPLYIPGTPYARAVQARARISSTVKAIVEERRSKGENSAGNKKSDFLEILLSANSLSEDERVSFVLDSLLGGYETTSLLMALAVLFLGQSPAALQQLRVINEALRCGNIVKFVHRKALKDVRFKDYSIPCGWKVLPVFSAVHLDTSLHGSVLDFHPWRWENQSQSTCKIFTPFGGGPRFCPGSELAKVETAFFLHHLVLNFRWTTEGVDQPMAYPYVEFHRGMPLKVDRLG